LKKGVWVYGVWVWCDEWIRIEYNIDGVIKLRYWEWNMRMILDLIYVKADNWNGRDIIAMFKLWRSWSV